MRRAALLGFALLLAPGALSAQDDPPDEPCTPKPGTGVVVGTVLDSLTTIPLEGAGVSVRWQPDRRTDWWEEEEGETDHAGGFRVCDAPFGVLLLVRAGFWGDRSKEQNATLAETGSEPLVLRVDGPHSLLAGTVRDAESGQPVVGAEVRLEGVTEVRITGADGAFQFGRVPPRDYQVEIRHLAYTTVVDTLDVDVAAGVNATIRVSPGVIPLDPITVVVRSLVLERAGFYERRDRSSGHFVTRQQIDDQHPLQSSELLRRIPGVRLLRGRNGLTAIARANCPFRFVIDNVRTGPDYTIDLLPTMDIEGLEIYMGPSQVPGEFMGFGTDIGGTCGVIVVWTRRNLKI
jgi:hypothetical protein